MFCLRLTTFHFPLSTVNCHCIIFCQKMQGLAENVHLLRRKRTFGRVENLLKNYHFTSCSCSVGHTEQMCRFVRNPPRYRRTNSPTCLYIVKIHIKRRRERRFHASFLVIMHKNMNKSFAAFFGKSCSKALEKIKNMVYNIFVGKSGEKFIESGEKFIKKYKATEIPKQEENI